MNIRNSRLTDALAIVWVSLLTVIIIISSTVWARTGFHGPQAFIWMGLVEWLAVIWFLVFAWWLLKMLLRFVQFLWRHVSMASGRSRRA
jgi:hypothetical protein